MMLMSENWLPAQCKFLGVPGWGLGCWFVGDLPLTCYFGGGLT